MFQALPSTVIIIIAILQAGNGLSVVAANMYGNNGAATLGNNGSTFGNNGVGSFGSNGAATLGPGPPQLNISNPRYSAMYRNTLLQEPLPPPTPGEPGRVKVLVLQKFHPKVRNHGEGPY